MNLFGNLQTINLIIVLMSSNPGGAEGLFPFTHLFIWDIQLYRSCKHMLLAYREYFRSHFIVSSSSLVLLYYMYKAINNSQLIIMLFNRVINLVIFLTYSYTSYSLRTIQLRSHSYMSQENPSTAAGYCVRGTHQEILSGRTEFPRKTEMSDRIGIMHACPTLFFWENLSSLF